MHDYCVVGREGTDSRNKKTEENRKIPLQNLIPQMKRINVNERPRVIRVCSRPRPDVENGYVSTIARNAVVVDKMQLLVDAILFGDHDEYDRSTVVKSVRSSADLTPPLRPSDHSRINYETAQFTQTAQLTPPSSPHAPPPTPPSSPRVIGCKDSKSSPTISRIANGDLQGTRHKRKKDSSVADTQSPPNRQKRIKTSSSLQTGTVFTVLGIRSRYKSSSGQWLNITAWQGYPETDNSIEPDQKFAHDPSPIQRYKQTDHWVWQVRLKHDRQHRTFHWLMLPSVASSALEDGHTQWVKRPEQMSTVNVTVPTRGAMTVRVSGVCPTGIDPRSGRRILFRRVPAPTTSANTASVVVQ